MSNRKGFLELKFSFSSFFFSCYYFLSIFRETKLDQTIASSGTISVYFSIKTKSIEVCAKCARFGAILSFNFDYLHNRGQFFFEIQKMWRQIQNMKKKFRMQKKKSECKKNEKTIEVSAYGQIILKIHYNHMDLSNAIELLNHKSYLIRANNGVYGNCSVPFEWCDLIGNKTDKLFREFFFLFFYFEITRANRCEPQK